MIYVISKSTCGSYNVRDIQCNANWDCCPYSDYALIPDNLVDGILATKGYCDITLNSDGTQVVSFNARTIPTVPEECCAEDQAATTPKTVSGSYISVKDSGDAPFMGLKLYGKTTQTTYSGKNLFPYPYNLSKESLHGVTFTDNRDGTITANGTSTEEVNYLLTPYTARLSLEPGTYVLSGCPAGGGGASYSINISGSALESNVNSWDEGNGLTFTVVDNSSTISVSIRLVHNKTYNNLTFKPMIRKASVTDGTWEPYTGGIASPNPNYPQPLESVGDSGSVTISIGKSVDDTECQTLTMQTPNGLAAIPVWWAGNYTDENGQQWIRDEIDFVRGVRIQRVGRGTVGIVGTVELNGLVGGIFGLPNKMAGNNIGSLCDRAVFNTSYTENTYYENSANLVVMGSATDTQESLAEKFNGATILYALATPIETPLSAEELAQYASLHTHKPNTTIFNNGGANMDVRYCTPNTAVPMNLGRTESVLTTDEHGCVTAMPIPEMQFGVEYLTTERYEGKQVYCRRMNLGAVTTGGGYFEIDNSWNILHWDAQCKEHSLPCQYYDSDTNGYICTLGVGRGRIYFNAGSWFDGYNLYITLWYVKE